IYIQYEEKDILEFELSDIWKIKEQDVLIEHILTFQNGVKDYVSQPIELKAEGIKYFDFEDYGELSLLTTTFQMDYTLPDYEFDYTLIFKFPELKDKNNQVLELTQYVNSQTGSFLSEKVEIEFDMNNTVNGFVYELIVEIASEQYINVEAGKEMDIRVEMADFDYKKLVGNITPPVQEIKKDEIDLDVKFWNDIQGDFNFTDPSIILTVNSIGIDMPIEIFLNATGLNGSNTVDFKGESLKFDNFNYNSYSIQKGIYNSTNSNVTRFLSLPPRDGIVYYGDVFLNGSGKKENCVLTEVGKVSMDLRMEIPLNFCSSDLEYRDTLRNVDIDNPEQVKKLAFLIKAKNELPFDVNIKEFRMVNKSMEYVDRIIADKLIDAPEIDANGNVISTKESLYEIELSEENIENLKDMVHLILIAQLETAGGGNIPVEVYADSRLDFTLMAKIKLDINK
ncbi:MAG: hypothetical protein LIO65_08210, partial [Odoribacter sp.]|nr:hypothetical protein [Odoribacter sp.]